MALNGVWGRLAPAGPGQSPGLSCLSFHYSSDAGERLLAAQSGEGGVDAWAGGAAGERRA